MCADYDLIMCFASSSEFDGPSFALLDGDLTAGGGL